ncbi:MAG: neutral/alkaline non-lysosomal ceramidase N-terminal domain-containing protein [Clostridia bacterium]|nr:neutral/alkaline non-lysosomal ceramidase N-terminal domain-containing protein [Clostridia bacterium]
MYKIGLYEREITALFGNSLSGYFNLRLVDGVKEKTYAKAAVIDDGNQTVALLAVDACGISDELCDAVYNKVSKYIDIKKSNLMISATHSHTAGPMDMNEPGADKKLDGLYLEWLYNACADTVICAYQRKVNASLKLAIAKIEGISFCRNYLLKNGVSRTNPGIGNPDIVKPIGDNDPFAPMLLVEDEKGKSLGVLYSFANHQDSVDGTEVSGDWSSIVSFRMKEKYGSDFISIMFYGTAGNINQVDVNNTDKDYNPVSCHHYLGNAVADGILSVIDTAREISGDIKVAYGSKIYENRVPTEQEIVELKRVFDSVELPENAKLDASSPKELFDACMAERALNFTFSTTKYYTVKMQIISIGKVMIFALPGEVFSQFGAKIKQAFPDNICFFACLSNNKWTYMPTKECYLPELYESLYGSAHFYPDDSEDIFDEFIKLGKDM